MRRDDHRGVIAFATLAVFLAGSAIFLLTGVTTIRHLLDNVISAYLLGWALYGMFNRMPLSETGTRFLLTTGSLVFCWVLAEGAVLLGLVDYRVLFGSYESGTALSVAGRRFDKELLWRHDPHYRYEAPYQGNIGRALCIPPDPARTVAVRYDRNGFRNARDLDSAEIVVIGDSYMEGYFTPDERVITTRLSELQEKSVANLGHSGYGPQQELVVLQRFGFPLAPQTVVWAFFEGNDFLDAERYEEKVLRSGNGWWQDFWFRSLSRNVSALLFRSEQPCTPDESLKELRAEFLDSMHRTTTVFFASAEVERVSEPTLRKAVAPIIRAAQLCRDRNIRFLVAFVPEKFRVYHDLPNLALSTAAIRQWHVSDVPGRLQRLLADADPRIEYVDLTPALKTAARSGIPTYLPDDTHWTDEGNLVAADAIHRALQKGFPAELPPRNP
ncbi:MAG: hypothetical protein KIT49_11975 [Nitrospira sp.]|nr:hypothetical protein [Nitrospira sp.]